MRFSVVAIVSSLVILLSSGLVGAAPLLDKRQIGDIQCNVERLKIVGALTAMQQTVNSLKTASASDPATSDAVQTIQTNLDSANAGIKQIAGAILTLQQAPAAARDQVAAGLTGMQSALGNITSTDTAVTSDVTKAQSQLQDAIAAGNGVVANCK